MTSNSSPRRPSALRASLLAPAVLASAVFAAAAPAPRIELASVSTLEVQGDQPSLRPAISDDGRFVAFQSQADTLTGRTDHLAIFVRDRQTGVTELVSAASNGEPADRDCSDAVISADGRFVAFESHATNLVENDANDSSDYFLRDRLTGMTERVSISSDEEEQWSGAIVPITADISADGRYVVFGSGASNLTAGDDNGVQDVFLRDRQLGITELISVTPEGVVGSGPSFGGAVSDDGRYVCFDSSASDLTPGDDNANIDVFVRDRELATTEKVSVGTNGTPGNGRSFRSAISADGSIVAFASESANLVQLDTNAVTDVFVRNRTLATTTRVSVASDGTEGNGASGWDQIGEYFPIGLSADGRFVFFGTFATSILERDRSQNFEAVIHDRATGISQRPVVVPGATPNLSPLHSSLSANGQLIAFASETPLLRSDKNRAADIYVADRKDPGSGRLSATAPKWQATVVGETSSATLKIANRGRGSLSVQASNVIGPFSIDPAFSQFTLAPGRRVQIPVTFAPIAAGPMSGEVTLHTDDPRRSIATLKLRARGR